jgi:hypothetical protein
MIGTGLDMTSGALFVKLSSATNSTSTDLAATPKAVKAAYDLAASKTSNEGTVTSIATGDGLTGGPITVSGTVSHAIPTGASATTLGNSTSRYYIKRITTDKFGHVTGVTTGNETVTDTKNTAGAANDTAKHFLIGAKS